MRPSPSDLANGGLSDLGRRAIAEMNQVGVIVDVAHSGLRTSLEAARASARPMVTSHTACAALNPHIRAKTDEVIKAIANTGGSCRTAPSSRSLWQLLREARMWQGQAKPQMKDRLTTDTMLTLVALCRRGKICIPTTADA